MQTDERPSDSTLPTSFKLAFGAPSFAGAAMAIPIAVLMPRFYSDVVLAPLGAIAIAIALARAFDALTDPLMGWLSDHTHTRFGRRKPYIAFGTPFAALCFVALFSPPGDLGAIGASLWFAASFTLFFLFFTIVEIPYAALGAELTPSYGERSTLFGYRAFFIAAGTITAALMPTLLAAAGWSDERQAFRAMAALYGLLLLLLNGGLLLGVQERRDYVLRESNPLVPGVRRALRNRPFRILLLAGIVSAIPAAIPAILLPYFVQYVLQPSEAGVMVGLFLVTYLGAGLVFVPLWLAVARRAGKLPTLIGVSAIGIAGSVFYFFAGPGDLLYAGCIYFVTGTVSMAGNFLIPAMAADVIDYDELRTGKRREAQYTSFWTLIPKFVAIPGASIPLAILSAVGYVPNQLQSEEVTFWIRFMYSAFPAAFYLVALAIVSRYPISERIHLAIRAGIAARAAGDQATDPLTGATLRPPNEGQVSEQEGWFLDTFSAGELRAALERGPRHLLGRVVAAALSAALVCAAACGVVLAGIRSFEEAPPLTTVFAIVVAGLALAATCFHGLRIRPAWRMRRGGVGEAAIRAHLEAR
jgi:GPH family glycoside/pentoside/hexuronide:cation symporter